MSGQAFYLTPCGASQSIYGSTEKHHDDKFFNYSSEIKIKVLKNI
ncbi:hypothetical protein PG5_01750 [Pseudomonas sp. G5(2012)]|nr:hypothetical protein PG5_01750 [Pseudomonas sp. G5(2012)]